MRRFLSSVFGSVQLRSARSVARARLAEAAVELPRTCANCGAPGGQVRNEASSRREILVPYCSRCFALASRTSTVALATALASIVMGGTALLTLPRLSATLSLGAYIALCAIAASLAPLLVARVGRRHEPDQTASGRAVWWQSADTLEGTRLPWFEELGRLNGIQISEGVSREPVLNFASWSGALLSVALAPHAYALLFPSLLVLNLASAEFELFVDGVPRGRVAPSSLESREAGLHLRVPAGKHVLEARPLDEPSPLAVRHVVLDAAGSYLFAPASDEYCFWLETDWYGRSPAQAPEAPRRSYEALPAGLQYWRLPSRIDTWFGDNPAAGSDQVSSGGSMTSLRQGRCNQLPDALTDNKPSVDHTQ
jgi:hypothetical protein